MIEKVSPYYKAVMGFIAPAAVVLVSAVTEASAGGADITSAEWITAACAAVLVAAGVYSVPNISVEHKQPKL